MEEGRRSPVHCSLLTILIGKYHFLSNTLHVQPAMCSTSFFLCFRSPMRTVSPTPEYSSVIRRKYTAFAACFQASTLSNFLRHSCYQTLPAPGINSATLPRDDHPSFPVGGSSQTGCGTPPHFHTLPQDFLGITPCQVPPALDLCFQLSLSRQIVLNWMCCCCFSSDLAPRACTFDKSQQGLSGF